MKTLLSIAPVAFAAVAAIGIPAGARDAMPALPAEQAETVHYVVDCEHRTLPSQREVSEWTGQHNFSQAYATRQRLMADIGRGCRKGGIAQVRVVSRTRADARDQGLIAVAGRDAD